MMAIAPKQKGRPPTGNARKVIVETRMSEDELKRLDYCCERTGRSRSEVIRTGIDKVYSELTDREEK